MKRFLQNTFLLSLILLAVITLIELALFLRPNTFSYKSDYASDHADDIHTLLLGNSHIERGVIPDSMDQGTFNMAISGRPLIYDVELARMHVPRMKALENVVMPLDYTFFYFGRNTNMVAGNTNQLEDNTYKCMYCKYMGIRVDGLWYWSELFNSKLNFLSRFFKNDEEARECDSLGYICSELSARSYLWKTLQIPKKMDLSKPANKDDYDLVYGYYDSLAEITNSHHVRLILVSTPMHEISRAAMYPEVRQEMRAFVERLQEKYPNVVYLDYMDEPHFEDQDFYDTGHLTEYGAAKFSKILNEGIRNCPPLEDR